LNDKTFKVMSAPQNSPVVVLENDQALPYTSQTNSPDVPLILRQMPQGYKERKEFREEIKDMSIYEKETVILRLCSVPDWYKAGSVGNNGVFSRIQRLIFKGLCMMSFGRADLNPVYAAICLEHVGDGKAWKERVKQVQDRLNNMLIVAGLLSAATALFLTTLSPRPEIGNYNIRGPYLCLLFSYAVFIGEIVVGYIALLVVSQATPTWAEKVFFSDRFHVYCSIFMLSWPLIANGIATLLLAFGLLSAVWFSNDLSAKVAAALTALLPPVFIGIVFIVYVATAQSRMGQNERGYNEREHGEQEKPDKSEEHRADLVNRIPYV